MDLNLQQKLDWIESGHESIKQKRKYTGLPYFKGHCLPIVNRAKSIFDETHQFYEDFIVASGGHDLLEDVAPFNFQYDERNCRRYLGEISTTFILELTNQFSKKNYPTYSRDRRKNLELQRLSNISGTSQTIKCLDILDNLKDIDLADTSFAVMYIKEKQSLVEVLTKAKAEIREEAVKRIKELVSQYL